MPTLVCPNGHNEEFSPVSAVVLTVVRSEERVSKHGIPYAVLLPSPTVTTYKCLTCGTEFVVEEF